MSFWDEVRERLGYIAKPAGAFAGGVAGTAKLLDPRHVDPENQLGYDNPLEGIRRGWNSAEGMYSAMNKVYGNYHDIGRLEGLLGGVTDIGYDPVTVVPIGGSGAKALESVPILGDVAKGAGTVGKIGEGANAASKAGQYGRRFLTGLQLTGEPVSAMGVAGIQGGIERIIPALAKSKAIANITEKLAPGVKAAEVAAPAVEKAATKVEKKAAPVAAKTVQDIADEAVHDTGVNKLKGMIGGEGPPRTKTNLKGEPLIGAAPTATTPASVAVSANNDARTTEAVQELVKQRAQKDAVSNVIAARAPNPNIEAGLGQPAAANIDMGDIQGPPSNLAAIPPFLARGTPTPQSSAIDNIMAARTTAPLSDFDKWRQAAMGPFSPTRASEALTPEQLAMMTQNYGQ